MPVHQSPGVQDSLGAIRGDPQERVIRNPMRLGIRIVPCPRKTSFGQRLRRPKVHDGFAFGDKAGLLGCQPVPKQMESRRRLLADEPHLEADEFRPAILEIYGERKPRSAVVVLGVGAQQIHAISVDGVEIGGHDRRIEMAVTVTPGVLHRLGEVSFMGQSDQHLVGMPKPRTHRMEPLGPALFRPRERASTPGCTITPGVANLGNT